MISVMSGIASKVNAPLIVLNTLIFAIIFSLDQSKCFAPVWDICVFEANCAAEIEDH